MKEALALNIDQAIKLLPVHFERPIILDTRRKIISTSKGNLMFRASREYSEIFSDKTWWTSVSKDALKDEIKYVVVALGYDGIIIIPSKIVLDFGEKYNVSTLKNGRQNVRLKMEHSRLYLYEGSNYIDLTDQFIPSNAKQLDNIRI